MGTASKDDVTTTSATLRCQFCLSWNRVDVSRASDRPKCGNCGVISWDLVQTANGTKKDFAGITGNFYERLSKQPPYPIELVCTACSVVVPQHDKAQSPIRNGGL